ncbi:Arc family DNA-binding protein [Burkholderia sp. BCCIQ04A]|uniref:Arc family DNA-binding protein n=1 Tax=Burkholderia anthinoferrum TaxID=3090833 RepID=A0ABU5WUF6_9BURK|nr:Arc family DNA-binding protein [Burkholderia anthinoferrum]MEB2535921.1 Arc family DNA-binding protein [Burkholderia anthinoferrum]MEB2562049.1 Arc family DNA-binding protein [Burkholderia anthinoferrum]MEB2582349.1 Arc family DNA-binding protein [Burkholderia anthinoferrum]MEB2632675.1 Arc family DNA-binding protein [Burkholderia anthinoferrum]
MSKDTKAPSRSADQFVVRLPDGMREQIAEEARKNNRSMNAEIVARLEFSLDPNNDPERIAALDQVAEYTKRVLDATDGEIAAMRRLVDAQEAMLSVTGGYLKAMAERVPQSENEVSNELVALMESLGSALAEHEIDDAIGAVRRMSELGTTMGILEKDPETGKYKRTALGEKIHDAPRTLNPSEDQEKSAAPPKRRMNTRRRPSE